jgi:hypothetical protein
MKMSFVVAVAQIILIIFPKVLHAQRVGIGSVVFTPVNMLDVKGAMVIGNLYSGVNTAPVNGLLIEGNTGIGLTNPTQKLDVLGNIRFSGAIMPNNLPGTAGQVLRSGGAGVAPVWGPQMNTIAAVEKWYLGPQNFNAFTTYQFTVTGVTGCTTASTISVTLAGSWGTQPDVTIHHVEARNGEFKFRISNNSLTTNYVGMDFNILVIR